MDLVAEREVEILSEEGYDIHVISLPLSSFKSSDPGALANHPDSQETDGVFDEASEEWDALLARPDARHLLSEMAREAREDYAAGRTTGTAVTNDGQLAAEQDSA